jgi:cysteine dioxygenase
MSGQRETEPNRFASLVEGLKVKLGPCSGIDSAEIDPKDLQDLMKAYVSDEKDWGQYAYADLSRGYTR